MISLDSIDGTKKNPRYADPNRANPSQNARLFSVRWMASSIEIKSMPSVRLKMLLSQVSSDSRRAAKPTPNEQDEDHEGANVETEAPHGMVHDKLQRPRTRLESQGTHGHYDDARL